MRQGTSVAVTRRRVSAWRASLSSIDIRTPHAWPSVLRRALCLAVFLGVLGLLAVVWLAAAAEVRDTERVRSATLRDEERRKHEEVGPLAALGAQRALARRQVVELERQLGGPAALDGLLADIQQAGFGRGLQLALLRPGAVILGMHDAEQPVALQLAGRYHDLGAFASDLARLPYLVSLASITLAPRPDGLVAMTATVRTFRRLDKAEEAAQQAAPRLDPALQNGKDKVKDRGKSKFAAQGAQPDAASRPETVVLAPVVFVPQVYLAAEARDPFDARKLAASPGMPALHAAPPRRPEALEALEAFPLDAIAWVGRMQRAGRTVALLEADRRLHAVQVGQRVGPDQGRVVRIGDDALIVSEQVQDASGAWIDRQVTLHMRMAQGHRK